MASSIPGIADGGRCVPDDELLEDLGRRYVAGVAVWLPDLPARQRRFTGGGRIWHQVGLMGSRVVSREVRYLDPLGAGDYGGDWVPFDAIRPALMQRSGGSTFCSLMEVGDPMLTTIEVVKAFAGGGATATLPKGSCPTFRVKPGGDFERVKDVSLTARTPIRVGYVAKVAKVPSRGPAGRFHFVSDGPMAGRFIRASATALTEPDTGDAQGAYQRGVTDGRLEAEAGFRPIALPDDLYERVPA
jgi:hypothetical protein